jgi:hypothetical protein
MSSTSSSQSEHSEYMVQSCRQAVPQHGGRERRKEATENFLAVRNLTMKMEAVCSSKRIATQPTSRDSTNSST